jgi:predicted O-methyltransferase YrrM
VRNVLRRLLGQRAVTSPVQEGGPQAPANLFLEFAPPGHFYSPLPDPAYVARKREKLFDARVSTIPGIEVNATQQLALAKQLATYYGELPFTDERSAGLRYYYQNDWFSYGDAIALYSMIRHVRPQRIIEVGSGYSSAVMLDTNDLFFSKSIGLTFIEPNPERLYSLLSEEDKRRCEIIVDEVQEVPVERFDQLEAKDILFIDSSHVVKIGSDVVHLLTNVLPTLKKGVLIHIHDVFWPFEYPEIWLSQGRAWNELYMVKAFLQFNTHFRILFFNSYLAENHLETVAASLPLFQSNTGGSIWLEKVA